MGCLVGLIKGIVGLIGGIIGLVVGLIGGVLGLIGGAIGLVVTCAVPLFIGLLCLAPFLLLLALLF